MNRERWAAVRALFDRAMAVAERERTAFVEANADGDAELRNEVLSLLGAHAEAGGFLAGTQIGVLAAGGAGAESDPPEVVRERIGAWRIVRTLGRGGMGVVYLGERATGDFEQRAAIKVVSGGAENADIVRRFQTERRILAALEHPAIARLVDGGTTDDGLPFFVMEYVEGETVLDFADARRLDLRARIELFLEICAAVEHAHQRLVLHRDLKPSNILVGADGRPKLLDFGIGKLLTAEEGAQRDATSTLGRWMTPIYASPEQLRGGQTTTATDVHGLGVVLFELLTGTRPFPRRAAPGSSREAEGLQEPPRRASTASAERTEPRAGERVTETNAAPEERAARRGTTPPRLRRQLAGDLDTIVGKALEPEPERRYASVGELANDLRRHLRGVPIQARPARAGERLCKLVLRHRAASFAIAAAALLLVALTAYHTATLRRERDKAEREAANANEIATFLTRLFEGADLVQTGGAALTARDLLDRGEKQLDERTDLQPAVHARLLMTLSLARESLGDVVRASELADRALELSESAPSPAGDLVSARLLKAHFLEMFDRHREALPIVERAVALAESDPQVPLKTRAKATMSLGNIYYYTGDKARAKATCERFVELEKQIGSPARIGDALNNLGAVLGSMGDVEGERARYLEAIAYFEKSTEKTAYEIYLPLENLAQLEILAGNVATAEPYLRRAMAAYEKVFGSENFEMAWMIAALAEVERQRGELERARGTIDRALALYEKFVEPGNTWWSWPLQISGKILLAEGKRDAGIAELERALAIEKAQEGDRSYWIKPIEEALAEARWAGTPPAAHPSPRSPPPLSGKN